MQQALLQLERLRRHYESAVHTYDLVSFLDLVHVLRVWAELKMELPKFNREFQEKRPFKTAVPIKKVLKRVKTRTYIFSHLPNNGVRTFASNGELFTGPNVNDGSFSVAIKMKRNTDGSIQLSQACFVDAVVDDSTRKFMENSKVKRCNFADWLGAEAVRVRFRDENKNTHQCSISRENLIRRLANTLDASHSSLTQTESISNRFDVPIKWLLQFRCGGLPLPYFITLKTAQDMLEFLPPLFGLNEST